VRGILSTGPVRARTLDEVALIHREMGAKRTFFFLGVLLGTGGMVVVQKTASLLRSLDLYTLLGLTITDTEDRTKPSHLCGSRQSSWRRLLLQQTVDDITPGSNGLLPHLPSCQGRAAGLVKHLVFSTMLHAHPCVVVDMLIVRWYTL